MGSPEFRRELIRAANRPEFDLDADRVAELLDWFEHMPGEIFNELLHSGVEFPDGYIRCWQDIGELGEETDRPSDD